MRHTDASHGLPRTAVPVRRVPTGCRRIPAREDGKDP